MIPQVDVNYLAVFAAAVVGMALGALWYSPVLFGKTWMSLTGLSEETLTKAKEKGMAKSYLIGFIGTLIMSYVLAHITSYASATTFLEGSLAGFWIWLGFIAPVALGTVLWEGKPVKLYILNTSYYLVALVLMGAILAVWV